jgi:hypothetical protein
MHSYHPGTGRWLSRDPIGESGGANLYAFVENDPINQRDLLGLLSYTERLRQIVAPALQNPAPEDEFNWFAEVDRKMQLFAGRAGHQIAGVATGPLALLEFMGRSLLDPMEGIQTLGGMPGAVWHDLKCFIRDRSERWKSGTFDERADVFMESLGDIAGFLATLGTKELDSLNGLRLARLRAMASEGRVGRWGNRADELLTAAQREQLLRHIDELGLNRADFGFWNNGISGYDDVFFQKVMLGRNAFPAAEADRLGMLAYRTAQGGNGRSVYETMTARAVVAHEAGHLVSTREGFAFTSGTWQDEALASLVGRQLPGLTPLERYQLLRDAAEVARRYGNTSVRELIPQIQRTQ